VRHIITLIPGDGIGPEVALAAKRCIEATGVDITWEQQQAGQEAIEKSGKPLPDSVLDSIKRNKVALKGPIITPIAEGYRSVNVQLRKELDLYACLRPCRYYAGTKSRYNNVDIVVIRENTEDLYAGIEFQIQQESTQEVINIIEKLKNVTLRKDSALSIKLISEFGSERIIRFAFEYASNFGRKKVTAVHKSNIMKFSDGLFLQNARKIAKEFEGKLVFEEILVDNLAMQLVLRPQHFDVLVLPNLYGDIISDLCAGLVGGLGLAPGANIGQDIAVFEPAHGAVPKYAGQNKVNPTATILSGALMLRYIKEDQAASRLEEAVKEVIKEGKSVTYDLKEDRNDPTAVGTQEMAEAIIHKLKS
jgi:isocitrate dehydrogenase (NAD+)